MIALLLSQNVHFIASDSDFREFSSSVPNYLTASFAVSATTLLNITGGYLDCRNYTISSSTQFFDNVEHMTMVNCYFNLKTTFANLLDSVDITASYITYSADTTSPAIKTLTNSLIQGLKLVVNDPLASMSSNNLYVGVYCSNFLDENGDLAGFLRQSSGDKIRNSFLRISAIAQTASNIGGVFVSMSGLEMIDANVIVSITHSFSNRTYIGGLAATSNTGFTLKNSSFLVEMNLGNFDGYLGGIIAYEYTNSTEVQNVSISNTFTLNTNYSSSQTFAIGGLFGFCKVGGFSAYELSIYDNITMKSTQPERTLMGGVVGDFDRSGANSLRSVHTFISGQLIVEQNLVFGGLTGESAELRAENCSVTSKLLFTIGANTTVGLLAGIVQAGEIKSCEVYGTATANADMYTSSSCAIGALVGNISNSLMENTFFSGNLSVSSTSTDEEATFYIGGLAAIASSLECDYAFINGSISMTTNIPTVAGILFGLLSYSTFEYSFCNANFTATCQTNSFVGSAIGNLENTTMKFIAVNGNYSIAGNGVFGLEFGKLTNISTVTNIVTAIKATLTRKIEYFGVAGDISEFNQSSILADCEIINTSWNFDGCAETLFLQSKDSIDVLGPEFAEDNSLNEKYPYIVRMPIENSNFEYILPAAGPYSTSYKIDALNMLYQTDQEYVICTGICQGKITSPEVFECSNPKYVDAFCVDQSTALIVLPKNSCLEANAVCNNGQSYCYRDSEYVNGSCQFICSGCTHGYCKSGSCLCDVYYAGATCDIYNCSSTSPQCFNYEGEICENDNEPTCICEDPEYFASATLNKCVFGCPGLKSTHGICIGDETARCFDYWVDSGKGLCDVCAEGYVEEEDKCINQELTCTGKDCGHGVCDESTFVCKCDNYWEGANCKQCFSYGSNCDLNESECDSKCNNHGSCQAYLSDICTCEEEFEGSQCSSCQHNHYFYDQCYDAQTCGVIQCYSHGHCEGSNSEAPTCACANYWQGERCQTCKDFGSSCNISQEECDAACCTQTVCNVHCVGSYNQYKCQCLAGFYGHDCLFTEQECDSQLCSGNGVCAGGIAPYCMCNGFWAENDCSVCKGFGENCDMSQPACSMQFCHSNGECQGFGNASVCVCKPNWNPASNCSACNKGYKVVNGECYEDKMSAGMVVFWIAFAILVSIAISYLIYWAVKKYEQKVTYDRLGTPLQQNEAANNPL